MLIKIVPSKRGHRRNLSEGRTVSFEVVEDSWRHTRLGRRLESVVQRGQKVQELTTQIGALPKSYLSIAGTLLSPLNPKDRYRVASCGK